MTIDLEQFKGHTPTDERWVPLTGYTSWEVSAGAAGEKPCDASIYLWADKLDARAPTAPLALLDCILQALLSQDQSDA